MILWIHRLDVLTIELRDSLSDDNVLNLLHLLHVRSVLEELRLTVVGTQVDNTDAFVPFSDGFRNLLAGRASQVTRTHQHDVHVRHCGVDGHGINDTVDAGLMALRPESLLRHQAQRRDVHHCLKYLLNVIGDITQRGLHGDLGTL